MFDDRDYRFGPVFDEVFKAEGIETIRTPWRAPKANAYAERWIRTVRHECLDRLMILRRANLESVLLTYVEHHNRDRPHRGLEARGAQSRRSPKAGGLRAPDEGLRLKPVNAGSAIVRRDRLGGIIHEYYRKAA